MVDLKNVFICSFIICIYNCQVDLVDIQKSYGYDIIVKGIDRGLDSKYIDLKGVKMLKVAKKRFVVNGTYKILQDLPNNLKASIITARKIGSAYIDLPGGSWKNLDCCKEYPKDKIIVPYWLNHSNTPDVCPTPKGEWEIYNITAEPSMLPSTPPYGEYRVKLQWLVNDEIIFQGVGHFDIVRVDT